ncbi:MAG: hypothetical protein AAF456_16270 [Planctomycetota bacterium]
MLPDAQAIAEQQTVVAPDPQEIPAATLPAAPPTEPTPVATPPKPALNTPVPMTAPPQTTQPDMGEAQPAPIYSPPVKTAFAGAPMAGGTLEDISHAEAMYQRDRQGIDGMSLIEARSWMALFDFRFRRFLAPRILRMLWILLMVALFLWFCFATFVMFVTVVGSLTAAGSAQNTLNDVPPALVTGNLAFATPEPQLNDGIGGDDFTNDFEQNVSDVLAVGGILGFLIAMVTYTLTVVGIFVILCWARVVFETLHVFYNVAGTLKAIEHKL